MFSGLSVPPIKTVVAITAAVSLTLLAGCSDDTSDSPPLAEGSASVAAPSEPSSNEPDSSAPPRTAPASNQAVNAAGELALEQVDGENDQTVWEADVQADSTKRSVQIDAASGDVLKNEIND